MTEVIGETLPLAIGIAISPIPIIAAILMLLSPRAKSTSVGFLIGWLAGIVVAIVLFTLLSSVIPQDTGGPSPVAGVIKIILGAASVVLGDQAVAGRPAEGEASEHAEMDVGHRLHDRRQSPRSWLPAGGGEPEEPAAGDRGGVIVGGAGLTVSQMTVVIIIFVLLAASTVLIPVVGYLIASARLAGPLDKLREWLVDNNAVIMAVLLLVIGVSMIGKGLANF